MKINILPDYIANKIAAGEVVQRPESVLKELLENSIDAKATNIEIVIRNAGKSLVQIIDNGEGMSEEDAILSIQRHATSKIRTYEDLEAIKTFGFRGEALSAIAAVSLLEIKTKTFNDELGTIIKVNENNKITIEKGSAPLGTSISVKNLFYNTPARRNFLKSNSTELKHLTETFKKIAISHPEISFKFYVDDEIVYDLPKQNLSERIDSVFGNRILDSLIEVKEFTEYLSIYGYIAKPTYLRKSKSEQILFLNKRYVNSKIVNHAVFSAFENILEKGDYPFFILFLEIDPSKIDINVHPSKLEVKFDEERDIYLFVNAVIKKSIGSYDLVPNMKFIDSEPNTSKINYNDYVPIKKNDYSDRPTSKSNSSIFSQDEIERIFGAISKEINDNVEISAANEPFSEKKSFEIYHKQIEFDSENEEASSPFIVSLHNKYILTQVKSGLMIIDQHIAHERILYESALNSMNKQGSLSQQLLFPQHIKLEPGDYELAFELREKLYSLGFDIKFQNNYNIVIYGLPYEIKPGEERKILIEILDEYRQNLQMGNLEVVDNIAKSFSCKAALKAGDRLSEQEMRALVDKLFATKMPYVCPHGRPIVIKIPLSEFDKRFGRTS